ncbi:hypothetical protein [Anaerotruncus sp. AF02-27]|uniref:hypothetical protein n=1 Tax=Anaerotruncus sp. AF02-27 TaxID=2292191 RepID=UPI001314BB7D|nr:hypothetical protein [Anaerotruncus sp. AF02-27]
MRNKTNRILCMILTVVMLLGVIPVQALAAAVDTGGMLAPSRFRTAGWKHLLTRG